MIEHATFSSLNYAILGIYLGAMMLIGVWFARRHKTTEDFFLAGRKMHWFVVGMSMYASLTSAITFMALPSTAYKNNISFLVVSLVSPLVAPFLVLVFYPFYHRLRVVTSYEYINRRFGTAARFFVSGLFILARLGWLATVIYAPALALATVTSIPLTWCILLMGVLATLYTALGGLSADIWTDVVQFVIMMAGVAWIVISLIERVPGGAAGIWQLASETGRTRIPVFDADLAVMSGLVVGISYFFQLMQDYGTDQTTVQRMMAIPSIRGVTRAIVFNAAVDLVIVAALLFIGLGLFAYHTAHPALLPDGIKGDQILAYYIIHALPDGVSGLMITALFAAAMSSMDSGISCVATVIINDFVKPLRGSTDNDAQDLVLARWLTFGLGMLSTGLAFYVSTFAQLIEAYTSVISLFSAPILALFLLGIFSRRVLLWHWLVSTAGGIGCNIWLQQATPVHWSYYFPASLGITFIVAWLLSRSSPRIPDVSLTIWGRQKAG